MDLFWGMSAALVKALPLHVVRVPPRFIFLIWVADPRTDPSSDEQMTCCAHNGTLARVLHCIKASMAMIPFYSQLRSLQFLRTHESHGAQPRMPSEDLSLNGAKIVADI